MVSLTFTIEEYTNSLNKNKPGIPSMEFTKLSNRNKQRIV